MVSPPRTLYASRGAQAVRAEPVTLVDLLDRLLAGGVTVHDHVTPTVADIDPVNLDVALVVAASATLTSR